MINRNRLYQVRNELLEDNALQNVLLAALFYAERMYFFKRWAGSTNWCKR